ncbi:hypothetical protein [Tessaracoccus flavescens]|uniref:hypothetical protein n=1 Tax=Tessaracoccus flavescens TaxID=399497 RepID=UPI0012602153|nr:hypothetical protein [Tessaracoccus flavescens]
MNTHATRKRARRLAASLIAAAVTVTTGAVTATEAEAEAASIHDCLTATEIASGLPTESLERSSGLFTEKPTAPDLVFT